MIDDPIERMLDDLYRALARSRCAVADGAEFELAGLDGEAARLASVVEAAPRAPRQHLLAALHRVLDELDALASDLTHQRGARLARQAAQAYAADRSAR